MHTLFADYCFVAHESARHLYFNRAQSSGANSTFSCLGVGSYPHGRIHGIANTQIETGVPKVADVMQQDIIAKYAGWFEHLRSALTSDRYDVVEVPSYYPFGHLLKDMTKARLRFVLHGMNSQLLAASYENHASLFEYVKAWRQLEQLSAHAADEIVAGSDAERLCFNERFGESNGIATLNPFLFLPRQIPALPREAPQNQISSDRAAFHIVYTGQLDGIHQPHRLPELKPRLGRIEAKFRAYGTSLKFRSNQTSDIIRTISPELDIVSDVENWWDYENPTTTIVAYPGSATVHWLPINAVLRGYTVCLSERAGCRPLFEQCGLDYYDFDATTELQPKALSTRLENYERLCGGIQREAASDKLLEIRETV